MLAGQWGLLYTFIRKPICQEHGVTGIFNIGRL